MIYVFSKQTHALCLQILAYRFQINQFIHQVPLTPLQQPFSSVSISSVSSPIIHTHNSPNFIQEVVSR